MRPFYCGTQYADWETWNCENCRKQGRYADADKTDWRWSCELQRALGEAYLGDGSVSEDVARSIGYIGNEARHNWECPEATPIIPRAEWAERLRPPPTRLAPLWLRARRALSAAWELWIKPWDRGDYDCYEGLRSPWLAWSVAWGIWKDYRVRI
jgi:hypothetical protein